MFYPGLELESNGKSTAFYNHRLARITRGFEHCGWLTSTVSPRLNARQSVIVEDFHKKCHVSSHESVPSTFIAATRAPRVQLTVKHVVARLWDMSTQKYNNFSIAAVMWE